METGPASVATTSPDSSCKPSCASPSLGQRAPCPSGGSLTNKWPPTRRSGAAHSAVGAGGPNPLAVTSSADCRHRPRPVSSARSHRTSTRDEMPSSSTASRSQLARLALLSIRSQLLSGQSSDKTSPGSPPPVPRSAARPVGGRPATEAKARLRAIWSTTGPGPRKPSRRESLSSNSRRPATCGASTAEG